MALRSVDGETVFQFFAFSCNSEEMTVWAFETSLIVMNHKIDLHAVPLASLPAVVLDTETTGLDTARDKVIEIGAVRLPCPDIGTAEQFQGLINPGVEVPSASTSIHGLSTADVRDAPDFPQVMARFNNWAGKSLIVGYSIAFDLAILRNECKNAGLDWKEPHSLELRDLLMMIAPESVAGSLEAAVLTIRLRRTDSHFQDPM